MVYRIISVDPSEKEYNWNYGHLVEHRRFTSRRIIKCGHSLEEREGLCDLPKIDFSGFDLLLVHPQPWSDSLKHIYEIREKYPRLGILIITGDCRVESESKEVFRDVEGFYILVKPATSRALLEAIDDVVREAREK